MDDMNKKKIEEIDQLLQEFDDFQDEIHDKVSKVKMSLKDMINAINDGYNGLQLREDRGKRWKRNFRKKLLKDMKKLETKNNNMKKENQKMVSELKEKFDRLLKDLK